MHILAVGMDYHTAPVEVREKFTFSDEDLPRALEQLKQTKSILECVIVSTCNRTEIYAVVDRLHMCGYFIRGFMENWFQVPRGEFTNYLSMHEDEAAIEHLFRVTSGLDSMIIGETQILGQIRTSFMAAQKYQATGTLFNTLFKQAITMAKKAHSETSIGENAISVSYAAVELGKRIFGNFKHKKVMIIGAGKMSELTVKHLHANGAEKVIVMNRSLEKARELASKFNGLPCSIEQIGEMINEVDIVISSTGAENTVLSYAEVLTAMNKRKSRPLFMIDIAVPRDIDPKVIEIPNVFLYDIDDLKDIVENNLEQRSKESVKVEGMIREEISAFQLWFKTLGVGPVIRALQEKAAIIHQETMDSLIKKLPDLDERELLVIRKLSKSMVNQMLHDPILRIKEMAAEKHGDEALRTFSNIFALEEAFAKDEEDQEQTIQIKDLPQSMFGELSVKTPAILAGY